jgi:hypothetical protein
VRLPADEAEKAAWIAQDAAVSDFWEIGGVGDAPVVWRDIYWKPQQPVVQTVNGVTMELVKITFLPEMTAYFSTNLPEKERAYDDPATATFDGLPVERFGYSGYQSDSLIFTGSLRTHPGELTGPAKLVMEFAMEEAGTEPFRFEVDIDPAQYVVEERFLDDGWATEE